jgi:inward rectifier potassium channel
MASTLPASDDQPSRIDSDLGFGAVVARESRRRLLNPDGSFNVAREGLGRIERLAPYHAFLVMRWPRFLALIAAFYAALNVAFAVAFWLCGPDAIIDPAGTVPDSPFARAFFFSVETLATIGYGSLAPSGLVANLLMTFEALVGLLAAALITGLMFARFSRPTARIRFSRHAVVAPYGDGADTAFEFRIANERRNELVQLEARVLFARMVDDAGRRLRRFDELALERQRVVFFPLSWTVVHPIDDASPLRGLTHDDLEASDAEFLVLLSGLDETNSQTVHARTSYKPHEIEWGSRFANVFNPPRDDGVLSIDVRRLDATQPAGGAAGGGGRG